MMTNEDDKQGTVMMTAHQVNYYFVRFCDFADKELKLAPEEFMCLLHIFTDRLKDQFTVDSIRTISGDDTVN